MSRPRSNYFSHGLVVALITFCAIAIIAYLNRPGSKKPTPQAEAPTTAPAVAQSDPAKPDVLRTQTPAETDRPGTSTPDRSTDSTRSPSTQPVAKQSWDTLLARNTTTTPKLIPLANVALSPEEAQKQIDAGNLLAARNALNAALIAGNQSPDHFEKTRGQLAEINRTVIFSTKRFPDDPFGGTYAVQNGDSLQKIARAHNVTWELLGRLNDISDPRKLRAGRAIKVINGPFHAVVNKGRFELDIWLGEPNSAEAMYVTTFRVGLGKESSTPEGTWVVTPGGKMKNPKFWGAGDLPPMEADDPQNPLGEFWLALTGIAGDAEGREGFGIHGTIDPTSIGKQASLGCIRLAAEDIALVYELLVDGKSKVYVRFGG